MVPKILRLENLHFFFNRHSSVNYRLSQIEGQTPCAFSYRRDDVILWRVGFGLRSIEWEITTVVYINILKYCQSRDSYMSKFRLVNKR